MPPLCVHFWRIKHFHPGKKLACRLLSLQQNPFPSAEISVSEMCIKKGIGIKTDSFFASNFFPIPAPKAYSPAGSRFPPCPALSLQRRE